MGYKVGIIPAAGRASRFGGTLKELLPAKDGRSFLRHAVNRLPVDLVVIVTNPDKVLSHMAEIGPDAAYILQRGTNDIWSAIETALQVRAERYYFTMPDTYLPPDIFAKPHDADFVLGTFATKTPERFGVLIGDMVINKQHDLPTPARAWGVLEWSERVVDFWRSSKPQEYTQAINAAMREFGYQTFPITYYHDNASMRDYFNFLAGEG